MRRFVFLFLILATVSTTVAPAAAAETILQEPVRAEVLDPFRLPSGPYGPGNRGIEYATVAGDRVGAAADGIVVFAGPVAGRVYVTIDHGGQLLTSYGPLETKSVLTGDNVNRGDMVGTALGPVHFSTRINHEYVDPASLFGHREVEVRLVPSVDDDIGREWLDLTERVERIRLLEMIEADEDGPGLWGAVVGAIAGQLGDLTGSSWASLLHFGPPNLDGFFSFIEGEVHRLEIILTLAVSLDPRLIIGRMIIGTFALIHHPPCTPAGVAATVAPPQGGERRIALTVAGLGSSSDSAHFMEALDLVAQGYAEDDVVGLSYNGGLIDQGGETWWEDSLRSQYSGSTTRQDVEQSADQLVQTLLAVAEANPGVTIDLYGHSLGGLVIKQALQSPKLKDLPIDVVVTIGSPLKGSPLAELVEAVEVTTPGSVAADIARVVQPDNILVAPAIEDLSESGLAGDTMDQGFPESVNAVTIGGRGDLIVPASHTSAPGASHVVVGDILDWGVHGELPGHPAVAQEIRLALLGMAPTCLGFVDRLLNLVAPEAIAGAEHALAAGILYSDIVKGPSPARTVTPVPVAKP